VVRVYGVVIGVVEMVLRCRDAMVVVFGSS
jgi:hypothetical protein